MKSKTIAALLAFFLGGFGAHKFYLGESGGVWRILLTCSIIGAPVSAVWALVDSVNLLTMDDDAFNLRHNNPSVSEPPPITQTATSLDNTQQPPLEPISPLPDGALCFAKGINGQVTLLEDRVRIDRKGIMSFLTYGLKGTKEIFSSEISSVEYRNAGSVISGYIIFLYRGGRDVKSSIFSDDSVANNENAVLFVQEAQPAFDTLRDMLNDQLEQYRRPQQRRPQRRRPQQAPVQTGQSPLDELKELAGLKEVGTITEEEFEREKTRILERS